MTATTHPNAQEVDEEELAEKAVRAFNQCLRDGIREARKRPRPPLPSTILEARPVPLFAHGPSTP